MAPNTSSNSINPTLTGREQREAVKMMMSPVLVLLLLDELGHHCQEDSGNEACEARRAIRAYGSTCRNARVAFSERILTQAHFRPPPGFKFEDFLEALVKPSISPFPSLRSLTLGGSWAPSPGPCMNPRDLIPVINHMPRLEALQLSHLQWFPQPFVQLKDRALKVLVLNCFHTNFRSPLRDPRYIVSPERIVRELVYSAAEVVGSIGVLAILAQDRQGPAFLEDKSASTVAKHHHPKDTIENGPFPGLSVVANAKTVLLDWPYINYSPRTDKLAQRELDQFLRMWPWFQGTQELVLLHQPLLRTSELLARFLPAGAISMPTVAPLIDVHIEFVTMEGTYTISIPS